jgi:hypothetical protein
MNTRQSPRVKLRRVAHRPVHQYQPAAMGAISTSHRSREHRELLRRGVRSFLRRASVARPRSFTRLLCCACPTACFSTVPARRDMPSTARSAIGRDGAAVILQAARGDLITMRETRAISFAPAPSVQRLSSPPLSSPPLKRHSSRDDKVPGCRATSSLPWSREIERVIAVSGRFGRFHRKKALFTGAGRRKN